MTKKLFWLFVLLLIPTLASAQGSRYDSTAQKTVQNFIAPIPGATIVVCSSAGTGTPCSPTAPIYTDAGLTQLIPGSTFTADSNGNFGFYAPPGTYTYSITATGVTGKLFTIVLPVNVGSNNTFTGSNMFNQQIISTVTVGTAPFSISSPTLVNNLNAQFHGGFAAPNSAPVGVSDTQPLTNKTIDCTANTLSKNPCIVYSTPSASTNASISATTMATAGASGNTYRVSWYFTNTALGTSCTGNSTVLFNLIWNDPSEGSAGTSPMQNLIAIGSGTANGVLGPIPTHANYSGFYNSAPFRAKANTAVQYSVTFVAGTGCSPAPSYQVYPILELIQ